MNAHVPPDAWALWRQAVADRKPVDSPKGVIALGFYRARDNEAVSFAEESGEIVCWRSSSFPAPRQADAMLDLFARVCLQPVSYEDFSAYCDAGRWPDQVAPVDVPADLPPHERAQATISAQREAMSEWLKSIGGAVTTQEHASKAGNFADEFAKLEKAATAAHKAEKEPHLEAGRAVDRTWKPVIERADELKRWAKKAVEPFLIAERARIAAEEKGAADARAKSAREAEEARRRAEATGEPPPAIQAAPPPAAPPLKAKAGRVHIRERTVHEITDMRAVLEYLAKLNQYPAELRDVAQLIVNRMRHAGVEVPGVETKTIEVAA